MAAVPHYMCLSFDIIFTAQSSCYGSRMFVMCNCIPITYPAVRTKLWSNLGLDQLLKVRDTWDNIEIYLRGGREGRDLGSESDPTPWNWPYAGKNISYPFTSRLTSPEIFLLAMVKIKWHFEHKFFKKSHLPNHFGGYCFVVSGYNHTVKLEKYILSHRSIDNFRLCKRYSVHWVCWRLPGNLHRSLPVLLVRM